jgi:hypothetical protein
VKKRYPEVVNIHCRKSSAPAIRRKDIGEVNITKIKAK